MQTISQTNVQLYNQLRRSGYSDKQLLLVHRAYQLAVKLNPGYFLASGKPLVSHTLGVASILASLDLPAPMVATACIHNIYVSGDFGDGLKTCITPQRRRLVQTAVGTEVESYVNRFSEFRLTMQSVSKILSRLGELDTMDRHLVVMDLADILEKYVDQSILYLNGKKHESSHKVDHYTPELIEMAEQLGYPQLAEALRQALRTTAEDSVPQFMVSANSYSKLVVPLSYRLRSKFTPQQLLPRIRRKLRRLQNHEHRLRRDGLIQ